MRKILLLAFIAFISVFQGFAQKGLISGIVTDAISGESVIGVNIVYGKGLGVVTDIDGKYNAQLPYGNYEITVSYVGYITQNQKITIGVKPVKLDFQMKTVTLSEVLVVGDIARQRETPVAFSTISPMKVQEQLAGRDIPMLLNSTPGVYASQVGGGDGDARVTIRGFSARNVGVLLDGVPVNDMENGTVYWSNWFGLDAVQRSIQVQRGLGASKLALPSVGGTINIITKGIDERKGGSFKQEIGSDGYSNTSFGYNSGKLKKGIGFTFAGSYKFGEGFVDHTWSEAYFLYGKVDKLIGHHIISLAAYGAPQSHGQRSFNLPAAVYSKKWALDHGVTEEDLTKYSTSYTFDRGIRYNQHWGQVEHYTITNYLKPNADTVRLAGVVKSGISERVNEFFKPQFTLKDFWTVNKRLSVSNIAYMSIGKGGGIKAYKTMPVLANGEMDFQNAYDYNSFHKITGPQTIYSSTLREGGNYLVESKNEHRWIGLLSTLNYIASPQITMSGGIDLRTYKGIHYQEIYSLLGAGYIRDASDHSQNYVTSDKRTMKYEGDKVNYYNDGLVRWGGVFYQAEYKKDRISAFINLTGARTGYKRVDHFQVDSLQATSWKNINGWTIKGGANYNITRHLSAFINMGYLDKAPRFKNVYDNFNKLLFGIKNEKVKAVEGGVAYSSSDFSMNVNVYYTNWLNRPVDNAPVVKITDPLGGQTVDYYANINGLSALHKGIELDFVYMLSEKVKVQGLLSLGDWIWNSSDSVRVTDDKGEVVQTAYVDAKGIHVGDAAQYQLGGDIRYEPIKYLYISASVTRFGKYYSNFDPMSYDANDKDNKYYANFSHPTDANGNVLLDEHGRAVYGKAIDPWKIPVYYLIDLHAGYSMKLNKKNRIQFRVNVMNVMNTLYVSDADDNSTYIGQNFKTHDARSAGVFFGPTRRYTMSLALEF
jgi:iron complex outermembrane recepter protein